MNRIPESLTFDLTKIIASRKLSSTLSDVGKNDYLKNHYFHTDKLLLFKNQVQKIGEPKTFISCHEFKSVAYMFKVKFLSKDGVNAVSYLMMIITLINVKNL